MLLYYEFVTQFAGIRIFFLQNRWTFGKVSETIVCCCTTRDWCWAVMESEVADCCTTSKKPVAVVAPCRRLTHSSELDAATTSKHDDEQHPPATTLVPPERHFTTRLFLKMFIAINVPSVLWRCWLGGRKGIRPVKTEWWGAGMAICLERGADLHTAQLMPLPLTVSCFSKIQIGFTFLVPALPGSPGKWPLNGCVYVLLTLIFYILAFRF